MKLPREEISNKFIYRADQIISKSIIEIDKHVGLKLRSRRLELGLSQTTVGDKLLVSFQQVQKYERGTNRISVSRLYDLCEILNVSVDYFYQGLPTSNDGPEIKCGEGIEITELVGQYFLIRSQTKRTCLSAMLRAIVS